MKYFPSGTLTNIKRLFQLLLLELEFGQACSEEVFLFLGSSTLTHLLVQEFNLGLKRELFNSSTPTHSSTLKHYLDRDL